MNEDNPKQKILNMKMNNLAFVLRGKNRREIYEHLLKSPLTISGLSCLTGIYLSNVSRVIKEFEERGLVENLTPELARGKLFRLTPQGLEIETRLGEYLLYQKKGI